jgi:MFS family permease
MAVSTANAGKGEASGSGAAHPAWPRPSQAYYTVFVMGLVVMFAEVDRGVMSLLVQAIKKDWALSDSSMGLLLGLSFAILYTAFAPFVGYLVDTRNRKNVLAIALAAWSTATMFCGAAQNFVQLFAARLALGGGEAVNGPAIFSIISDSFPKERLPRGIALMQLGVTAGNAFSLIMGALVIQLLINMPPQTIPLIGVVRWWQMVFVAVGLPGFLVALLLALTVKEPARKAASEALAYDRPGFPTVMAYMARHWQVYGALFGSLGISALGQGALSWHAAYYMRTFHWTAQKVGYTTGLLNLVTVPIGLFLGVWFYERLVKKGVVDAPMRVVIIGRLITLPAAILIPLAPNVWVAIGAATFQAMMIGLTGSSVNAALQIITPPAMRGQMTAWYLVLFSVVGNGLSPWIIGLMTDHIFRDPDLLRYAILTTTLLFSPASLLVFWLGRKPFAREVERLGLAGPPAAAA